MASIKFSTDDRAPLLHHQGLYSLDQDEAERQTADVQRYDSDDRKRQHTARKIGQGCRHLRLEARQ